MWVKSQFVLSRVDYHYRHEPILYGHKEGKGVDGTGASRFRMDTDLHIPVDTGTVEFKEDGNAYVLYFCYTPLY